MSQIVAPRASQREIVDALNALAGRFAVGSVTLGSGTSTAIVDSRINPRSVILLTPDSAGADASTVRPVPGAGEAVMSHGSQEGQVFRYLVVNPQ